MATGDGGRVMDGPYFISYSRVDAEDIAERLTDELVAGPPPYAVWLDVRDLQPGVDWDTQIRDALRDCSGLLFVVTADSVQDHSATKQEWVWALRYKKPVIPLRFDADAELPLRLESRQSIDFSDGFEVGLARLRTYLASVGSPKWVLEDLRDQLAEAEREMPRAGPQQGPRVRQDIEDLQRRVAEQERLVADPQAATRRTEERIAAGLEQQRVIDFAPTGRHVGAQTPQETRGQEPWSGEKKIFLCYRREDTEGFARGIYESLAGRYGREQVFRDIDSTPPGVKFSAWIEARVGQCDVMIVLIGKGWLSAKNRTGERRLDLPNDWVRQEIKTALERDIPILPVQVQGALMPSEDELPSSIADLAGFQSAEVTDRRWDYDLGQLIEAIDNLIAPD
jgi:hypothetical protein